MNILKNMEAIFLVTAALACATAFAASPAAPAPGVQATPVNAQMITVVITGKRLSAGL